MSDELMLIQIEGCDGSRWTISGPGAGREGVVLGKSPKGFWETPRSTIWTQGAFQESATFEGDKVDMMTAVFTIHIASVPGQSWQQVYSRWKRAWSTRKKTTVVGTTEYGIRKLELQMLQHMEFEPEYDPAYNSYGFVVMQCRPPWPFWVEDDVFDLFQSSAENQVTLSTPIVIPDGNGGTASYTTVYRGTVVTSNPTDWPMHHKWVVENNHSALGRVQIPDFSWEDDPEEDDYEWRDRAIWVPSLAASENLVIDSYPDNETWRSNINPMFVGRSAGVEFEFSVPEWTEPVDIPITCTAPNMSVMLVQRRNWSSLIGGW